MKIPLFDIDGTLFKTANPVHRDAFEYAFKKTYGINAKQTDISPEGKVDNQIILEVLEKHGISEKEIKQKIKDATKEMTIYFEENKNSVNPEILPGVINLLKKLRHKNIPIGMLTGNVEEIAWIKIEKAGLKDFFDFGAFGDKAFKRVELVEHAKNNAEKALNKCFKTTDFVIIGDTPRDIECAKDAGINVIAVSTGIYPFEELLNEKPNLVVHYLDDKSVFEFLEI